MPNPADAIFARDLDYMNADVFSDLDVIVITNTDGTRHKFSAVIDRKSPTPVAGAPGAAALLFEFWISRNAYPHIPDKNGDTCTFASQPGYEPTDHRIIDILASDGGGWLVRCR